MRGARRRRSCSARSLISQRSTRSGPVRGQAAARAAHAACHVSRVACLSHVCAFERDRHATRVPVCRRCARICTRCTGRSEQALPTTTLLPISSTSAPVLVTSAPGLADYKRSASCSTAFASRRFSLLFSEHGREGTRCQGRPRVACRAAFGTMPPWDTVLCGYHAAWDTVPHGIRAAWDTVPHGIPCRMGYRALWMPCRKGYRAAWDTVPHGIPCRVGYHAGWDTVLCGCRAACAGLVSNERWEQLMTAKQLVEEVCMHTWLVARHRASPAADGAQSPEGQRYSDES
jgi:hypothetical protein